ncbi:MAG: hypothetical protein MPW16_11690 [Candidatus Manganitrophus sp.]|nr:MAG: hypothetical protein MPW16_11690 [Candidatus Manganitrophus sp.]
MITKGGVGIDMIVYGGQEEVVDASEQLDQLQALFFSLEKEGFRDHDRIVELLIEWGVFESAVADALSPDFDSEGPLLRRLRQASRLIGRLFYRSAQFQTDDIPSRLGRALKDPLFSTLPPKIALRVPEGYERNISPPCRKGRLLIFPGAPTFIKLD